MDEPIAINTIVFSGINACASSPCVHGVCVDEHLSYSCSCTSGWIGTTCTEGKKESSTRAGIRSAKHQSVGRHKTFASSRKILSIVICDIVNNVIRWSLCEFRRDLLCFL